MWRTANGGQSWEHVFDEGYANASLVRAAEERVRAAKRDVGLLGTSYGGTVIVTSQIEGTVLRRNATVGAQVDPEGDPLFEIGNPKDLWVVADVFQDDLGMIQPGAKVTLDLAALPQAVEGTVSSIGVLLDTAVRRAPVYVELDPEDRELLRAGMFARALIGKSRTGWSGPCPTRPDRRAGSGRRGCPASNRPVRRRRSGTAPARARR